MLDDIATAFDARAATYDRNAWHLHCAERLVELAAPRSGDRVLDACCGTGFVALAVAGRVGPSGRVLGVDISEGMLAQARLKTSTRKVTNVSFERHDATSLDHLSPGLFDAVLCAAGILYVSAAKALAAWWEVLRPGGLVGF